MFKSLMIIMKKELRRVFTDRRLIITNFILPAVSIAIIYSLMGFMIGRTSDEIEAHTTTILSVNMPAEVAALIDADETMVYTDMEISKADAEAKIKDAEYDYYLYFDPGFSQKIVDYTSGTLPKVEGLYSPKSDLSIEANYKVGRLLEVYRNQVLADRLGGESFLQAFSLETAEIELPKEDKGLDRSIANLIPMLVSIFIFAGAMGIGMDSIAGEKERGTIATMLLTPVDRGVIIGGKVLSLSVVALISMISSFIGVILSIPFSAKFLSSDGNFDMSQFALGGNELFMFFLCMIGLVGMYVTIISVLSMIANSLKEAGAYITPAYMLVMITAFMNMFSGSDVNGVSYYIPIYNNLVNMKQILTGDGNFINVLIAFGTSVVITLALLFIARKLMHKEKIVFPS
ncbi:ABC transporter permease [Fusibacter bizertensis]